MSVPRSSISYCDYSGGDLNFVVGCTPVSEGCEHCYARALLKRFGKDPDQVIVYPEKLKRLEGWRPKPPWKRERPLAFVVDMGDLFHEQVPFDFIDAAVDLMNRRSDVDWIILTKRPQRMLEWWSQTGEYLGGNLWIGVTVENQRKVDERLPLLLQMPATVRWVSAEPMLEAISLTWPVLRAGRPLHWAVCGAESGPQRRPFDLSWARGLYAECRALGIPYFYKQGSALRPGQDAELPGLGIVQEWPEVRHD